MWQWLARASRDVTSQKAKAWMNDGTHVEKKSADVDDAKSSALYLPTQQSERQEF